MATYIDVHPDTILLTDVSDTMQVVEGAEHGGTAGGADEERNATVAARLCNLLLEVRQQDLTPETKRGDLNFTLNQTAVILPTKLFHYDAIMSSCINI